MAEANAFRSEGIGSKAQQRIFAPRAGEKETARPASRVRQVIDEQRARGIEGVKGDHQEGERTGNWLSKHQAQSLLQEVRPLRDVCK